jgi:tetratricopeptide (TPR) repeat protein
VPTLRAEDRETVADSSAADEPGRAQPGDRPEHSGSPEAIAETLAAAGGERGSDDPSASLPPGTEISHFIVERPLGAGGMGVVVAARDRLLDRRVAIKVLRHGFGGGADRAAARLLREARAMALLQHPGVVTVFEVGTHDGRIFLAMELVDGATLGQWLGEAPRTWREIVDVFARAGRGLAAAHRLGMVHRDFKPENVLVGRDGQVRVTDFGLVGMARGDDDFAPGADRAGGPPSSLDQPLTHTGALLGTPRYMAPEQHLHMPVTAKADQFAFCVALHEALYGAPPFPGQSLHELRGRVLSGEPTPPPAGAERDAPPRLRGIVLRGLALAPDARWPDMAALLDALTRDPSLARRRWAVAAGGAAVVGAAAIGLAVLGRSAEPPPCPSPAPRLDGVWDAPARAAVAAAFTATHRPYAADTFARASAALDGYAQRWIAMRTEACEATAVRHEQSAALLDRRMQCLDRRLTELGALTQLFRGAGDPIVVDRAVPAVLGLSSLASCADADGLLAQVPPPADPAARAEVAALRTELARSVALTRAGKPKDALAAVTPLVPRARALGHAPVLAEVLLQLGTMQRDVGDPRDAEATIIEAARTGAEAKDDALVARALIEQMWIVGYRGGRRSEALALAPYIQTAVTRAGGDPLVLGGMYRYQAILLNAEGKYAEALAVGQKALELCSRASPEGREVANALVTLGNTELERDELAKAQADYEHARAIFARLYGPDHPDVATAQNNVANVLLTQGKLIAALEAYRAVLAVTEQVSGPEAQRTGMVLNNVGIVLDDLERWDEAHATNLRALAIYEKNLGKDHPDVIEPLVNLGEEMRVRERLPEAEAYFSRALALREAAFGKDSVRAAYPLELMARLRVRQRRFGDALAMARRIVAIREHGLPAGNPKTAVSLVLLGEAEAGVGHARAGLDDAERGIALLTQSSVVDPEELGDAWFALARIARAAGQNARAQVAADRARTAYTGLESEPRRARKLAELAAWPAHAPH